jgi:hypothetical protein
MKRTVAVFGFFNSNHDLIFSAVWDREPSMPEYVRISEWVEVEFQPRNDDEVQHDCGCAKRDQVAKLEKQLAELKGQI